ncbi:hypothetical protein [Microcoleus sp. FACHB-672]|uniref:hypothetical protein n=1 Tax=Microcoleus sp. FACHB-672 TaxID=2692825 RepID=UPI0016876670|nr:hypothetical protein [Microcoleus sp. FACHB-672]MBD2041638.1 hypothetical protein [Microcoleus sp. FACHB-672]
MTWFNIVAKKCSVAQMVWDKKPQPPQLPTFIMKAIFTASGLGDEEDEKLEPVEIDVELEIFDEVDISERDKELEREEIEQNPDAGTKAEPNHFELHLGWNSESLLVAAD